MSEAFRLTDTSNQAWDLIDATIHEWHESSIAIISPELAAAFNDENKEGNHVKIYVQIMIKVAIKHNLS